LEENKHEERPWNEPKKLKVLELNLVLEISILDFKVLAKRRILLDIRSDVEFRECALQKSIHMNFDKDHNIDTFINYLECVGRTSFSLENIIMEDNALGRHYKELYKDINMIIIVDNYGSSDTKLVIQMLIEQGIKHLCILKGGIQAAKLDAKEKL